MLTVIRHMFTPLPEMPVSMHGGDVTRFLGAREMPGGGGTIFTWWMVDDTAPMEVVRVHFNTTWTAPPRWDATLQHAAVVFMASMMEHHIWLEPRFLRPAIV